MGFKRAIRYKSKLRLAIVGPSGCGKTHSALLIASGLSGGNQIAMIDTERGKGLMEAGKDGIPSYLYDEITPPYTPQKYIEKIIEGAAAVGSDGVLIIDSISHEWHGDGGILDMHGKAVDEQQNENSWAAWRNVTPKQNEFIDTLLSVNCHVIVTMRSKTAWEVHTNSQGKKVPVKIGLAPVQKKDVEYEFTAAISLNQRSHVVDYIRDSTGIFEGKVFVPSNETGLDLYHWLNEGADGIKAGYKSKAVISAEIKNDLMEEAKAFSDPEELAAWGKDSSERFGLLVGDDLSVVKEFCSKRFNSLSEQKIKGGGDQ